MHTYKITKTLMNEITTIDSGLSMKKARTLLKGLRKIKLSAAKKFGGMGITPITSSSIVFASFSVIKDKDGIYVPFIYQIEPEQ